MNKWVRSVLSIALVVAFTLSMVAFAAFAEETPAQPFLTGEDSIPDLIAVMTVAEKASLLGGVSAGNRVRGAAGGTQHNLWEKYGIPGTSLPDGPAGVRITATHSSFVDNDGNPFTRYATQFPNASGRAATWNTGLLKKLGGAIGNELVYFGSDLLLAPGMNIHRHPLCGRNFEYYSEDPLLSGKVSAAEVTGVQSKGGGTTIKHFAANNQETSRHDLPTNVDIRALREIYLRGFEITVRDAKPWAIMTAYNQINGVSPPQNPELLAQIARDEWGFEGIFMTDWGGSGNRSYWPAQSGNNAQSSMVKAGLDLCMPRGNSNNIIAGYNAGFLTMDELDAAVERFLKYILKTPTFNGSLPSSADNIYMEENEAIALEVATEAMVLLKNETVGGKPALPITSGNIAAIGNATNNLVRGGTGSGNVNIDNSRLVHLEQALRDVYTGGSIIVDTSANPPLETLTEIVNQADSVIMTIRRVSGEFSDRRAIKGDYYLSDDEAGLIENASQICREQGKPLIIVLNTGAPIEVESWKDKVDALLLAWQPGTVLAKPIAAGLLGYANPSGKLPMSFPIDVVGADENGMPYNPAVNFAVSPVTYTEGIYTGYRYYDSFNVPVSYEFGYGLSYTSFEYSNLKVLPRKFKDKVTVTVDVTNTGNVAGKEAVQLYLSAPAVKLDKPFQELKAFAKTKLLEPGETQSITFELDQIALASFDPDRSAWVAEAGNYLVRISASSQDIRQTAFFKLDEELVVENTNNVLLPPVEIELIKPVSLNSMIELVNGYLESGDIRGPLVPQVSTKLAQFEQQLRVDNLKGAVSKLEQFLKQINNKGLARFISDEAKEKLNKDANELIRIWSGLQQYYPI